MLTRFYLKKPSHLLRYKSSKQTVKRFSELKAAFVKLSANPGITVLYREGKNIPTAIKLCSNS